MRHRYSHHSQPCGNMCKRAHRPKQRWHPTTVSQHALRARGRRQRQRNKSHKIHQTNQYERAATLPKQKGAPAPMQTTSHGQSAAAAPTNTNPAGGSNNLSTHPKREDRAARRHTRARSGGAETKREGEPAQTMANRK